MKTALLAWELGGGFGHATNLHRIAGRLRSHGVRTVAIARLVEAMAPYRDVFDEIENAPVWPIHEPAAAPELPRYSATLNDILSAAGLADSEAVQRILSAWDGILARIRPDLVVADYAPLASLAARRRISLVVVGNGFTVPPHEMPRFPLLHRLSPPAFDETRTLATVNAAAATLGFSQLDRLPQLFSGDACLAQCPRLLDPFDTQRVSPVDGPVFDEPPIPCATHAEQVFVHLSSDGTEWPSLHKALVPVAKRLRVHAPLWPKSELDQLAAAGARIDIKPQPLASTLASSRLVIHHGGSGVAAQALAASVPQLVLSRHIEQDLNGEALERAGVARLIKPHQQGTHLEPGLISSLVADDTMAAQAEAFGTRLRGFMARHNALDHCEAVCMGLLR